MPARLTEAQQETPRHRRGGGPGSGGSGAEKRHFVNVFSNELCHGDIAVAEGLIVGMGEYHGKVEMDVSGKIVLPGFLDAHIHLESSWSVPRSS